MIGLTTGRRPSQALNSLLKDIAHTIPRTKIIRRGKSSLSDLASSLPGEGVSRTMALHRWRGGLARLDFYDVQPGGMILLVPAVLIASAKLRREHGVQGRHVADGITCDPNISEQTRKFSQFLSGVLELPESNNRNYPRMRTTIHLSEKGKNIHLAVTSPPSQCVVGPSLVISKFIWDLNEATKES